MVRPWPWGAPRWNRRKNGELYAEALSISDVGDGIGAVAHYVALFGAISERMAAQERIQYLAHQDVLIGLPNRVLLRDRVDVAMAHARREKNRLALLHMDLDRFKLIYDSLRYEIGDELLRQAAVSAGALKPQDLPPFRWRSTSRLGSSRRATSSISWLKSWRTKDCHPRCWNSR